MKAIKDRRNVYAALSVTAILLTLLFIVIHKTKVAIACGGMTTVALFLLYRQNRILSITMAIGDSRILTVPSSIVTSENQPNQKQAEETIISTFGLLLGNKVNQWGCDGVYGVRLREVHIEKEHICLSFGVDDKMLRVRLLHGLTDKQSIMEIAQKIWYETGVQASIVGTRRFE